MSLQVKKQPISFKAGDQKIKQCNATRGMRGWLFQPSMWTMELINDLIKDLMHDLMNDLMYDLKNDLINNLINN